MHALNFNSHSKLPVRAGVLPRLSLLLAVLTMGLLAGCSDDPGSPAEPAFEVTIDGIQLGQIVVEGEPASLSVWGTSPRNGRDVDGIHVLVLAEPGERPGLIRVSFVTSPSTEASGSRSQFQLTVPLPDLAAGDYDVEFAGSDRRETLTVFPRGGWIWYRAHGDPMLPSEGLRILRDGLTIAFREDEGRPGRMRLDESALEEVARWFDEAGFVNLEDRYLSGRRPQGRFYEVVLGDGDVRKRVLAEAGLAPEPLLRLVESLSGLVDRVLANRPEPPAIAGYMAVDPPLGEAGSDRVLKLTLFNHSPETVTLIFPTTQLYDLLILRPGWGPSDRGPGDSDAPPDRPHVLIWNWAYERDFAQVVTELTFAPGEAKEFEETWDGLSNAGRVVGQGVYHVQARIPADVRVPVRPARLLVGRDHPNPSPLLATLAMEPMVGPPGTERELTLYVTNVSRERFAMTFLSTQQYDFAIEDPRSMRPGFLWLWSLGRGFGDVVFLEAWAPGETKVFTEVWDGKTHGGVELGPGRYAVHGWLAMEGRPPLQRARSIPLVIESP
jgi:hypothetical protein